MESVLFAAEFDPPVAVFPVPVAAGAIGQIVAACNTWGAGGRREGLRCGKGTGLEEAGYSHGSRIGLFRRDGFSELGARLAAHSPGGAGEGGENAIA